MAKINQSSVMEGAEALEKEVGGWRGGGGWGEEGLEDRRAL